MLICLDYISITWEDIPFAIELAELGAWSECAALFRSPYPVYDLCNNFPVISEAGKLDSDTCA
jgi:hypothetical protein